MKFLFQPPAKMKCLVACSTAIAGMFLIAWMMTAAAPVPDFDAVRARWHPSDAQLLDRHGEPIHELRIDRHGRRLAWVALADMSPALPNVVILSEDRRFWRHHGVDAIAVAASIVHRFLGRRGRGASTITMQLAALLDPALAPGARRRNAKQKLAQIIAAIELERRWSKRQILEAYLNLATYRGEVQGIGAAARVMFGKAPQGIDAGEAIVLATLLRAPNAHRGAVIQRAQRLRAAIGPDAPASAEVVAAMARAFAPSSIDSTRIALAPRVAERVMRPGTDSVRCTLDRELQRFSSDALRAQIAEVRDRHVEDGAVLVAENSTGEVWAYVGGSGDLSSASYVDGVRARRQPGSALKPFLYALAIQRRLLTPASIIEDSPLELPEERGIYRPLDYDRRFRGLVSMRTALASSLNVPAVRTAEMIGVEALTEHLRELGFGGIVEQGDYYGGSVALGSADVTLWELVNAYRTLANSGIQSPLRLVAQNDGRSGQRIIYSPATAYLISDILSDRASRSATFGLENNLATRFWSAVKTGTSKDMRDNWCVGYTDKFTVGVWVGNFSGAAMRDVSGITGAAPVWLEVMNYLHERFGSGAPQRPAGLIVRTVEFPNSVEPARQEWFLGGTEPNTPIGPMDEGAPQIVSPAPETIIALDPDIPRAQQQVAFEAGRGAATSRWLLDRRDLGPAAHITLWPPTPGPHTLSLVDRQGRTLDTITFKVRGTRFSPDYPESR